MSKDKPEIIAVDGSTFEVGIVASRFNHKYVNAMLESAINTLTASGVDEDNITIYRVPGSNEIPYVASQLARAANVDVIIGLGLVIAGETPHHEIIGNGTEYALQKISVELETPVINGIVTVMNEEQAEARTLGDFDRGREFAYAALEMAKLSRELIQDMDDLLDLDDMLEMMGDEEFDGDENDR